MNVIALAPRAGTLRARSRAFPAANLSIWIGFAAVCCGTFAFGSVYPWGYVPLAGSCLASGLLGLVPADPSTPRVPSLRFTVALALVGGAILVQLIPIPVGLLQALSPHTVIVLREIDPSVAAGLTAWHSVSIFPASTWLALALYACFAVFLIGFSRALSYVSPARFLGALTIVAVVVSITGIVQRSAGNGRIYGFWSPQMSGGESFGPFINKDHCAGWLLLALLPALSMFLHGLNRSLARLKPDWRSRVIWVSTPDASRLILLGAAVVVMTVGLVMTMSRSAIGALGLALVVYAALLMATGTTWRRRAAGAAYLVLMVFAVAAFVGVDLLVAHFYNTNWRELNYRRGAWVDTLSIVRDFPLTGTGLNTFAVADLLYQRHNLDRSFSAAHNDYLQLASEGGALVVVPALSAAVMLLLDSWKRLQESQTASWWLRAGAVTAIASIGIQELVDFSLQIPAVAVLFAAMCAVALHRPASSPARSVVKDRFNSLPFPCASAPLARSHRRT